LTGGSVFEYTSGISKDDSLNVMSKVLLAGTEPNKVSSTVNPAVQECPNMYGDANLPTTISVASSTRFESDILGGSSAKAANDRPTTTQIVKIIRISYVAQQSIDNGI
jgi:hypothetical protein